MSKRRNLSRRQALAGAGAAAVSATLAGPASGQASKVDFVPGPSMLWYRQPAAEWVEALPLGNGRQGAMVFGGVASERIQLNEDTFFAGGPYEAINPAGKATLPEIRKLIFAGKYLEAQQLAEKTLFGTPARQMAYQTIGDLLISFPVIEKATDYARALDLETAIATTQFSASANLSGPAQHVREAFISAPDQVMVLRFACSAARRITANFAFATPQAADIAAEGSDTLVMSGVSPDYSGIEGRLPFEARLRVIAKGGTVRASEGGVYVAGADEVMVLVAIATGYRAFNDISADPVAINRARIAAAAGRSFAKLKARHVEDYRALFDRATIDLGRTPAALEPTDTRIANFANGSDPDLAALYLKFARYLLIAASRPETQPANLQGIWNDRTDPPWESKWTININIQMNYWPSGPGQLLECLDPLARMVEDLSLTGGRVARDLYGARGWVAHHNTDVWRAATPADAARFGTWPLGGAWLCSNLWDGYDYSRDRAWLARIYPLLKGASEFCLDTLQRHPRTGEWVTNPSMSPENAHPFGSTLCAGPAGDTQILRDLFDNTFEAARILDRDAGLRSELRAARRRLPPDRIGKAGQLQEWFDDWDMEAPDKSHRHVSHLYALHPASQITPEDTPALAQAARTTLNQRGDDSTGWAIAWRINLWARLKDAERSYSLLQGLLSPKRSYPNLFDAHPPFQIDGNFGGATGIAEMILQSYRGRILLLPALPRAFANGRARGLLARGGFEVDLTWADGTLTEATIRSRAGRPVEMFHGPRRLPLTLKAGENARIGLRDGRLAVMKDQG